MTMALAREAKKKVWDQWGAYIPKDLKHYDVSEICKFHGDKGSYDIAFSATFVRVFRGANNIACRAGDTFAGGIAAFVTADERPQDRKIHVSPKGLSEPGMKLDDPAALIAHEYIHWLSHPNFYPKYYKIGGQNPFRVEGFTEWLMMECFPPNAVTVVYVDEYEKTKSWLAGDKRNRDRLLSFIFAGIETDLSDLHP